ncbi:hypothetical protein [Pyrobaculum islandicum]|uniref:hypothetical protein n=1 Tax=Pyrobaculum islandicum TaxID=2277 RepID=UPI0014330C19|nr:hypothetical protein [Pyrobaculum islandicum]
MNLLFADTSWPAAVALNGAVVKAALGGMLLTFAARAVASNLPTSPASYAAVATPSPVHTGDTHRRVDGTRGKTAVEQTRF